MRLNSLIWTLVIIGILWLIITFAGHLLVIAFRFWYITVPVILFIIFKSSNKQKKKTEKPDDDIEDADFEIIEDDKKED